MISGAGIAGIGVARLLTRAGVKRPGRLRPGRRDLPLPPGADELGEGLRRQGDEPRAAARLAGRDAARAPMSSSGSRRGNIVTDEMVRSMAPDPIVFALAVPEPEIDPAAAPRRRRQGDRHRPLRLPEHDGRLARLPGRLPRAARFAARATSACGCCSTPPRRWPRWSSRTSCTPTTSCPRIFDFRVAPAIAAAVVRGAIEAARPAATSRPSRWPSARAATSTRVACCPPRPSTPRARTRRSARKRSTCGERHGGVLEIRSQDPDPRPPHPEHALRPAGGAGAGARDPRRPVAR